MAKTVEGRFFWRVNMDNDGIINLIVAIIEQAREDYHRNIVNCDFFEARRLAD